MRVFAFLLLCLCAVGAAVAQPAPSAGGGPGAIPGCPYGSQSNCSIPTYSAGVAYAANQLVTGSDGNIYRAVSTSSAGNNPTTDCGTYWLPVGIYSTTTRPIPSVCATVQAFKVWTRAIGAMSAGATVTGNLADGTYAQGTQEHNVGHAFGAQIFLTGNVAAKANVVLTSTVSSATCEGTLSSGGGLFCVSNGQTGWTINGMMLTGPGTATINYGGVFAFGRSKIATGSAVTISGFYFGCYAGNGSYTKCDGITVSGGDDGNIFAYGGATISFEGGTSTGASSTHSYASCGAVIEHGSTLLGYNATFSNNVGCGLLIDNTSTAYLGNATASSNGNCGLIMVAGATADTTSLAMASNTAAGTGGRCSSSADPNKPYLLGYSATFSGWNAIATGQVLQNNVSTYAGTATQNLNTQGLATWGALNSAGSDCQLIVGSPSQSARNFTGLGTGARAEFTCNGPTSFSTGMYSNAPFSIHTNNIVRNTWSGAGDFADNTFAYSAPATGATVTIAAGVQRQIINPAGTLATLTVTLPACNSTNSGIVKVFGFTQVVTALTINASSGTVVGGLSAAAIGSNFRFLCYGTNAAWYPAG